MKILIVNKFLYPNGGSETYIFKIGEQLSKMGHCVEYFGMEHEGRIVGNHAESYTSDMDFHTGKLKKLLYPFQIIYSVDARKKIRKVLDDFSPDVVHVNNFNFQLTPSILYEIKQYEKQAGRKIRLIYTAHDYQLVCPNHMMRIPLAGENCERCLSEGFHNCMKYRCIHSSRVKSLLGSLEGWMYSTLKTYRYFDRMICPSEFMKKKLDENPVFSDKTVVMHNFVNSSKGERLPKKEYVLYFGRFSEEKGIRTFLSACQSLPEIPFLFAGSGPLEDEVQKAENVKCLGFQKGGALYRLIAEAAFSVYPSEWYENCPFSVMESIIYGTPVLGADIGGIPELVVQDENGELFKSGDADDLREKIWKLWKDRERLERYTQKCGEKHFDTVEEYCEKLVKLYAE